MNIQLRGQEVKVKFVRYMTDYSPALVTVSPSGVTNEVLTVAIEFSNLKDGEIIIDTETMADVLPALREGNIITGDEVRMVTSSDGMEFPVFRLSENGKALLRQGDLAIRKKEEGNIYLVKDLSENDAPRQMDVEEVITLARDTASIEEDDIEFITAGQAIHYLDDFNYSIRQEEK